MSLPLLLAALAILILVTLVTLHQLRRRNSEAGDTFTLGAQMAAAAETDNRHRSLHGDAISPLANASYNRWNGETDLLNPIESPVDSIIQDLLHQFGQAPPNNRDDLRARMSMDDFYTLLTFSRRMAAFAMRTGEDDQLRQGFIAMAALDAARIDPRDMKTCLSLLNHAGKRIKADRSRLFRTASALAPEEGARIIKAFHRRWERQKSVRNWGFEEVIAETGAGFAHSHSFGYAPTIDMSRHLIPIAAIVRADRYAPTVTLALPHVPNWFLPASPVDTEQLGLVFKRVRAIADVGGRLRPEHCERADAQRLVIFLFECADRDDSTFLKRLALSRAKEEARVTLTQGRVFCLVVGRSFIGDVESYETPESIQRFREPIDQVLRSGLANPQ